MRCIPPNRALRISAELLGHIDPRVTIEHYIRHDERVNPLTAELLEEAFAPDADPTV